MAISNAIVVSKVQQKGRKLILVETNEASYQHSADLLIELQMETGTASPFNGLLIEAMGKPAGNEHSYHCPIIEETGKKYIMLSSDVLKEQGILKLSIGGINDEKLVVTSNTIDLCIDESNGIISKISLTEKYWQIEVRNAMRYWYETQLKPQYDEMSSRLEQAEAIRATSENNRKIAEGNRVTAETGRVNVESSRVTAENSRKAFEINRITAENNRVSEENARVLAENARAIKESTRLNSENTRIDNEITRNTAESNRVNAESNRTTGEIKRANAETLRSTAEIARVTAEQARVNTESLRSIAETSRSNMETSRVTAETARTTAETGRKNAEADRVTAENKRQTDTTTAVNRANTAAERCEDVADGNYATQADINKLTSEKLDKAGGTITGNLTLKNSSNYGSKINFGDSDFVHISEPSDDTLELKGSFINFLNSGTNTPVFDVSNGIAKYKTIEIATKNDLGTFLPLTGGRLDSGLEFTKEGALGSRDNNANLVSLAQYWKNSSTVWLGSQLKPTEIHSSIAPKWRDNGSNNKTFAMIEDTLALTGGTMTGNISFPEDYGFLVDTSLGAKWLLKKNKNGSVQLGTGAHGLTLFANRRPVIIENNKVETIAIQSEVTSILSKVSTTIELTIPAGASVGSQYFISVSDPNIRATTHIPVGARMSDTSASPVNMSMFALAGGLIHSDATLKNTGPCVVLTVLKSPTTAISNTSLLIDLLFTPKVT